MYTHEDKEFRKHLTKSEKKNVNVSQNFLNQKMKYKIVNIYI